MNYLDIGNRIRKKRQDMNLSQEQLAEAVEISTTHMSHIETGNTKLSLPVLVKIANALNTSSDELLCDTLISAKRIYIGEIADILNNCDNTQVRIITDLIKSIKQSFDKYCK